MSYHRARLAIVDHDAIAGGLWALACFDRALVHFAELRQIWRHRPEDDPLRISLERATQVYLEGQCEELLRSAGITTEAADAEFRAALGDSNIAATYVNGWACTPDPLVADLISYAAHLAALTSHGIGPWRRLDTTYCEMRRHKREGS